ncbi:MAG: hypothetical protein ABJB74_18595 [Gemmatimonas sp.]
MEFADARTRELDVLPPSLRILLDAELAAGNRITKIDRNPPADGQGICVMLATPISTRPRETGDGLTFRRVSSSLHSAWFTDADRQSFLMEAPLESDGAYPDMNAIRDSANKQRPNVVIKAGNVVLDKFQAAMHVDYDMWHDGVGYKLDVLTSATDDEKARIVKMLAPPSGWRDIEALAALETEAARVEMRNALKHGNSEVRAAVLRYAPTVASDGEKLETILHALKYGQFYDDLTSVLGQVEEYHPPEVVNALFRGLFARPGEIATNYAGMLTFIHGKADSAFDWDQRPLFLKFNSDDSAERERAFQELCALLELNPTDVMTRIKE